MKFTLCFYLFVFGSSAIELPASAQTNTIQLSPDQVEKQRKADELVNTPFDFYGKIIDENQQPVAGAMAHILVMGEVGRTEGQTNHDVTSDAKGLVSLKGIRAFGIIVTVSKAGYLSLGGSDLPGGGSSRQHPTPEKAAIYHLQQK